MTPELEVALISATPPTLVALVAAWLGWINRNRLVEVKAHVDGILSRTADERDKAQDALENYSAAVKDMNAKEP